MQVVGGFFVAVVGFELGPIAVFFLLVKKAGRSISSVNFRFPHFPSRASRWHDWGALTLFHDSAYVLLLCHIGCEENPKHTAWCYTRSVKKAALHGSSAMEGVQF
jgi:hypothetical protein